MRNLIWNLSNKAVLFSGLLKEEHPQNENIHAKLQRQEREGDVVQEGKVDYRGQDTASQWSEMKHPLLGIHKKCKLCFLS